MKNKTLTIITIINSILILVIYAFAGYILIQNNVNNESSIETSDDLYVENERIVVSKDEFISNYTTKEEITTENFKDYVVLENKEEEHKDAFGELQLTKKYSELKFKDNITGNVALKIKIKPELLYFPDKSENTFIYTGYTNSENLLIKNKSTDKKINDTTITMEDLEIIKAQGTIYILDIPDNLWNNGEQLCIDDKTFFKNENYLQYLYEFLNQ